MSDIRVRDADRPAPDREQRAGLLEETFRIARDMMRGSAADEPIERTVDRLLFQVRSLWSDCRLTYATVTGDRLQVRRALATSSHPPRDELPPLPDLAPGDGYHWHADATHGLAFPLWAQGHCVGYWLLERDRPWHDDERQAIAHLADSLALALANRLNRQARDRSQQQLDTVLQRAPIVIYALDRRGTVRLAQGRGLQRLRLRGEDLVGSNLFDRFGNDLELRDRFSRVLSGETVTWTCEWQGIIYEHQTVPLHDRDGRCTGVIGVATDISERVAAEEHLIALNRHLEQRIGDRTRSLQRTHSQLVAEIERRRTLEAELCRSEAQFRAMNDVSPSGIFFCNPEGNLVYANRKFRKLLARNLAQLQGKGWQHAVHPDDRPRLIRSWQYSLSQRCGFTRQLRFLARDDRQVWADLQVVTVLEGDRFLGFVGTVQDITQRRLAEIALRDSEAKFRQLTENIDGVFWLCERIHNEFVYTYVSAAYERIWGRPRAQLYADKAVYFESVHPQDRARVRAATHLRHHHDKPFDEEFRIVQPNGSTRWIRDRAFPIRNNAGNIQRFAGFAEDITSRKLAEREALKNRALREAIFNESADAIFLVNAANLNTIDCNRRALELFEASERDDLLGIDPSTLQQRSPTRQELRSVLAEMRDRGFSIREVQYTTLSGKPFWGNLAAKPLSVGGVGMYLVRVTDISDRKQTEAELRRINEQLVLANAELARATRQKDEFLANMSHELRTPLNSILGLSEALQGTSLGELSDRQRRCLDIIRSSGKHLLALINDILDLAKVEAGKLELQIESIPIARLCESSLTFVRHQARKKNIRLVGEFDDYRDRRIAVDERRLRQVLLNLLSNAVKFTGDGGRVLLNVTEDDRALYFSVIDTGIGIAADDLPKLFRAFTQIDSSLTRRYPGTGLGLVLVKQIVELHGGTVTVTSEEGKGSHFTVVLPQQRLAVASPPEQPADNAATAATDRQRSGALQPAADGDRPLVLIADDNPSNVETFSTYLETSGFAVAVATDGNDAVEKVKAEQPQAVVMDVQMPKLDGLTAISEIRQDPEMAKLPVVVVTAMAMPGDRERCLAAGANAYFSKPLSPRLLAQTLWQQIRQAFPPEPSA